jgi:hypothetical protein
MVEDASSAEATSEDSPGLDETSGANVLPAAEDDESEVSWVAPTAPPIATPAAGMSVFAWPVTGAAGPAGFFFLNILNSLLKNMFFLC